jgi:hypothetical protein
MFDIQTQNHGSIILFSGVTPEGAAWLEENLDPNAQRWCNGFAVEPRYALAILAGAENDGLVVAA